MALKAACVDTLKRRLPSVTSETSVSHTYANNTSSCAVAANYNRISLCLQVFYNLLEIIVILFLHRFIARPYLYIKLKFKNHQTGYFPQPLKYAILLPAFYAWYHNESFDYALEQQCAFQPASQSTKAARCRDWTVTESAFSFTWASVLLASMTARIVVQELRLLGRRLGKPKLYFLSHQLQCY